MPSGGNRKGAGRKRHDPPLKPHCVTMTDEQARLLRVWGKGDLSAGLRWLIEAAAPLVRRAEKKDGNRLDEAKEES